MKEAVITFPEKIEDENFVTRVSLDGKYKIVYDKSTRLYTGFYRDRKLSEPNKLIDPINSAIASKFLENLKKIERLRKK